jgi:LacI family transcriptional regulator
MTLDTKPPKYLDIANSIEKELNNGAWEGKKIPSVRVIAAKYEISTVTASRALQVLQDKGLVQARERSGCYRIPPPTADHWALQLRLTPNNYLTHSTSVAQSGFVALSRKLPMHLKFDAFSITPGLTIPEATRAAAQAKAEGLKGVFLLPSRTCEAETHAEEAFLAGCKAAELSVVLLERGLRKRRKLPADLVAIDDLSAARECTHHLLDRGCRRIGIVVASPISSHDDRVAGYLLAMHEFGNDKLEPVVLHQPIDIPSREGMAEVTRMVLDHRLDGVLCYQDYLAFGLMMELLQKKKRIPQDVAIIGFDNLPLSDDVSIGLTSYDYPAEAMAAAALEVMKQRIARPDRGLVKVQVPGSLKVRASA